MLRLTLFGGFSAAGADGTEIALKSQKAKALLAYLALPPGKSRSREEIMALLWSDRGEAQARASLRQVLTGLRKNLGEEAMAALNTTDDAVSLDPDKVTITAANAGEELLAGFHLHDPAFEEWLRDERLRLEDTAAPGDRPAGPSLPDKPTIAVLPFDNMSGDPEQEYFADGISEDIITALSKFRWFFVSARNSTFAYRGTAINIKQIGQELNVRYVLEGSVRKAGKRVRITAQLIEAQSGNHIWADRYDRDLEDIFDLQDEIQQAIVAAVEPELVSAEFQRASKKSSDDLAAWDLLQQAMWHLNQRNEEDTSRAVKLFEETIARDSSMARAYSGYSRTLINMIGYGWSRKPEEHLRKTKELALEAVRKDDSDPFNHDALGRVFSFHNDPENAIREHRIALKLNPNSAYTHWGLGEALRMADRHEEALTHLEEAIRLSPRDSLLFIMESYKGLSLESLGRIQEAENAFLRGVSLRPDMIWMTMLLVDFYVRHERLTDARELVERASPRLPDLSLSYARNSINPHISLRGENLIENLRAAGLPD